MNLQAAIDLNCVIVKQGNKYCVKSEDRSKNLGCKPSKGGAKKRLREVEYFKHLKGGGVGSGRHATGKQKKDPEKLLKKSGFVRDNSVVNSPFGKAYRHPKYPGHRFHVMRESAVASDDLDFGGPGSGRKKRGKDLKYDPRQSSIYGPEHTKELVEIGKKKK